MFCDLVGSTSLAANLDAEDWRNLVNAYLDQASAAVTGLGGHVLKKLGDGLIVFLVDVTAERRMEAELQAYANLVAHDLSEPLASMQLLVTLLEQHPDTPPSPEVRLVSTVPGSHSLVLLKSAR